MDELVHHEENSYKFSSSGELSAQLQKWFENISNDENHKQIEKKFKAELESFQKIRWRENWTNVASPVFQ